MLATTKPAKKRAHQNNQQPLDVFFSPKTVAVIGATENPGSVGRTLLWNLVTSPFGGTVYPVNPKRPSVLGVKAYKSVSDIPEEVDLAVIVTPPPSIPGLIRECGENGVRGAIVISAGFKEVGAEGAALEQKLLEEARAANIRVIGPNCLGVMAPLTGMNATFATTIARPGSVGFISQSGAEFYFELARAYSRAGNPREAIRWCEESLRRRPGFQPASKELATALIAAGRGRLVPECPIQN
jgi:acetyltransferase